VRAAVAVGGFADVGQHVPAVGEQERDADQRKAHGAGALGDQLDRRAKRRADAIAAPGRARGALDRARRLAAAVGLGERSGELVGGEQRGRERLEPGADLGVVAQRQRRGVRAHRGLRVVERVGGAAEVVVVHRAQLRVELRVGGVAGGVLGGMEIAGEEAPPRALLRGTQLARPRCGRSRRLGMRDHG
jgi:hypothetical protein